MEITPITPIDDHRDRTIDAIEKLAKSQKPHQISIPGQTTMNNNKLKAVLAVILAAIAQVLRILEIVDIPDWLIDSITAVIAFVAGLFGGRHFEQKRSQQS